MSIIKRLKGIKPYEVTFSFTPPVMGFIKPTITTTEIVKSKKENIKAVLQTYFNEEYGQPIQNLEILDIKG